MKKRYLLLLLSLFVAVIVFAATQLTNLPSVYINTVGNVAITSKDDYVQATLEMVADSTVPGLYNDSTEIRGRGNSSWGLAKKPYRLKLYNQTKLLGMPANDEIWTVLANHADKTLFRNALAFEISERCGMYYTPAYRYVDVTLNGNYIGNYMIADQVERNKARVNLDKLEVTDSVMPDITGGYLLEVDGFAEMSTAEGALFPEGFYSDWSNKVSIKYPKDDEINGLQRSYIINHYNAFENAVRNFVVGTTDTSALSQYLDFEAFANWYITTEMTANPDCVWSIYMKKMRNDDRFYFGPIWDNDISFGNCNRIYSVSNDGRSESILLECFLNTNARNLVNKILTVPEMLHLVGRRWEQIKPGFKDSILNHIDSMTTLLNASQALNFQRWPVLNSVVYNELTARGTYSAEVAFLRDYMSDRIDYLDGFFTAMRDSTTDPEIPTDPTFLFEPQDGMYYYVQCQNDKYLMCQSEGDGYKLAASTVLPEDTARARFEITYDKPTEKDTAIYYLRNEFTDMYVYMDSSAGPVMLDPISKTPFRLYESPNEDNHFGLMAMSDNASINTKGIDCNSVSVVIWSTNNQKGQREYQFIPTGLTVVGLVKPDKSFEGNLAGCVRTSSGNILLSGVTANQWVRIYGIDGRVVHTAFADGNDLAFPVSCGVYIVTVSNQRVKVLVR